MSEQQERRNPWLVKSMQGTHPGCQTSSGDDRLRMVRESTDVAWLREVMAWEETQLTVRKAAAARARKLGRERRVL